jgi:hypothetical protein
MTRPLYEPTTPRQVRKLGFGTDQLFRRPPSVRRGGHFEIKLFADRGALDGNLPDSAVVVSNGAGKFMLVIPPDLNHAVLGLAEAGISAAASIDVEVDLVNVGPDPGTPASIAMLLSPITITAGDYVSWTPGTSVGSTPIDDANAEVLSGDWISIDVLSGGADTAEGLAVVLDFGFVPVTPSS